MEKIIKLTQLLSSKLCHELAGLIGAVDNCVGLLEFNSTQETAKKLLDINSKKLVSSIRLYRQLYGFTHLDEEMSPAELKNLISSNLEDDKILIFEELIKENIPLNIAKIIIGLVICAKDNLIKDGKILISINIIKNNFVIKIKVTGSGSNIESNIKIKQSKIDLLLHGAELDDLNVQNVHEFYVHHLCQQQNFAINVNNPAKSIEYVVKKIQE